METVNPLGGLAAEGQAADPRKAFQDALAAPLPSPSLSPGDYNPQTFDGSPEATLNRGAPNYLLDIGKGIGDGVESFTESVVNLGIGGANLLLDEENELDNVDFGVFDAPETAAGGIAKGITQFAIGFIPVAGQVGRLAQAGKLLSVVKGASTAATIGRAAIAGAVTDFIAFDEHEERLSNLIETSPALANPITEFLAAEADDGFIEGRLKNVIEGAALGIPADYILAGIKGFRGIQRAQGQGEEAILQANQEAAELAAEAIEQGVQKQAAQNQAITDAPIPSAFNLGGQRLERAMAEIMDEVTLAPSNLTDIADSIAKGFNGPAEFNSRIIRDPEVMEPMVRAITSQLSDLRIRIGDQEMIGRARSFLKKLNEDGVSVLDSLNKDVDDTAFLAAREIVYAATADGMMKTQRIQAVQTARALGTDALEAETTKLMGITEGAMNFIASYRQLGTNEARAFRSRQIITESLDDVIKKQTDLMAGMRAAANGTEDQKRLLLRTIINAEDPFSLEKELTRATKSGWFERHNEFWINSILSSFRTQAVNLVGNTTKLLVQPAELILGGVLEGNMKAAGTGLRTYRYMLSNFSESVTMAKKAFATGEAMLDPHHSVLDTRRGAPGRLAASGEGEQTFLANTLNNQQNAISSMGFDVDKGQHPIWAGVIDLLGGTINLPAKFLITFDEFFKQMNFRSRAMAQLAGDAAADGTARNSEDLARTLRDGMSEIVTQNDRISNGAQFSGKELSEQSYRLAQDARQYAEESTWTQDLRPGSLARWVQDGAQAHPVLQLVVPFVRTPTNIILDSVQHTPGLHYLSKTFREQLQSADPLIRSQARGKLAMGTGVSMTALALAGNGLITGSGPKDFRQRQTLETTGWRPNSIAVPQADGSTKYISYSRLEPFGAVLGMFADYAETGAQMKENDQQTAAGAIFLSLTRNLTSKTFLFGLTDAMDAITSGDAEEIGRWFDRRAASYLPNVVNDFNNDPYLRETQGVLEAVQARVPGWSQNLAPRRNYLGEAITAPPGYLPWAEGSAVANGISPVGLSTSVNDPVKKELGRLGRAFTAPSPRIENQSVDLNAFRMPDGQQAYDRYQELVGEVELRGKTFAQALEELVASDHYNSFNQAGIGATSDNPRVQLITSVRSRYARAARAQLLRESPEILSAVKEARFNRIQARRSSSLQAADSQLLTR